MEKTKFNDNTIRFRFGNPLSTDAVVLTEVGGHSETNLEKYNILADETGTISLPIAEEDLVLCLGETLGGINKRGKVYESFATDDPIHTPEKKALYGAHNFLIFEGSKTFGLFIDSPGKVIFDVGFTTTDIVSIKVENPDYDLYLIEGDTVNSISTEFRKLIGKPYVPPKWAFGYQQCRWSYPDHLEIRDVAKNMRANDIPCDTIYLDIDYMEDFKDFTVSEERFPDFENFVSEMKEDGFRLIPIIDAGVKIEEGYDIYEEGKEKGYFAVDEDGEPFVAAVWPGRVHFPDFLNPEARLWFGEKYKWLIDQGIEGFWNDMNEPAIFYSEQGLKEAFDHARISENENLNIYSFFGLKDKFMNLSNNDEDYKRFYHKVDGKMVNHYDVHNLYGYNMTRAAAEGFERIDENKRFLMFSRASYVGMHRYGGIWMGDNSSWWEHIRLNLTMLPGLNMCGFLYSGADTGGFSCDADSELSIRWSQLSAFTPLFRNHAAMGTRRQEPYAFDDKTTAIKRNIINFRYALIPYIYSEYMKAVREDQLLFKPLLFDYPDEDARRVETQLCMGDGLMIAPVMERNARGRYVYVPEDMLLWKVKDYRERTFEIMEKGHHYIPVALEEMPLFIRKNKLIVLGEHGQTVETMPKDELLVVGYVSDQATYVLYDDDGTTKDYDDGKYSEVTIDVKYDDGEFDIRVHNEGNTELKKIKLELMDKEGRLKCTSIEL